MNTGTKPAQKTRKQDAQGNEIPVEEVGEASDQKQVPDQEQPKTNCAPSFLMEKRGELDPTCDDPPPEKREEYVVKDEEKEAGGEG
jgi:hypothetical protein